MSTPKAFKFSKVAIGCDHAAVALKNEVVAHLKSLGIPTVIDVGAHTADSVDYPDYAATLCGLVARKEVEVGFLFCGSGIGISIAANKCDGIRAALCHDYYTALMAREHNDANVMCAGARVTGSEVVKQMCEVFLSTAFLNSGNHPRRVEKLDDMSKAVLMPVNTE